MEVRQLKKGRDCMFFGLLHDCSDNVRLFTIHKSHFCSKCVPVSIIFILSSALPVDGARTNSYSSFEMVEGLEQNGVDVPKEQNSGMSLVFHTLLICLSNTSFVSDAQVLV